MKFNFLKYSDTGKYGEELAVKYLQKKKFLVKTRNYSKPYGEIDIVAQKGRKIFFIEVKTTKIDYQVSRESFSLLNKIDTKKLSNLEKTINNYLGENSLLDNDWRFGVITVFLTQDDKLFKIEEYWDF
ncbi:MAG TPA: endonuclease [Candidatus Vogelbacteria bacterium]|nr:endonuclease [Candidatus Vogelbacteria bacterium]